MLRLKAPGHEMPSWQCQHLPYWLRHSKPLGMRPLRGNASTCPIDWDTQSPWAWDAFVAMPAPALLIQTLKAPGHETPSWQCQHLPYRLRHSKPLGMRRLRGNASTCPIDWDTQSPWAWDAFVAMPAPALLIQTLKAPGHETPSWQCQHLPYWFRHSKPLGMRRLRGNASTCPIDSDTQSPWAWDAFVAMPAPALLIQTLKAPGHETPSWQCQHLPYWFRHSKPLGMRRLRGNASTCPIDWDTQSLWAWDAFVAMPAPALLIQTLKAPWRETPSWQCQHLPYWFRHSKPLGVRPLRGNASTCPIDSDTQSPWAWDAFVAMPAPALLIQTLKAPGHETPSWQCQHLPYWLRHSKPLGMRPLRGNASTCPIDSDTQSPWAWDPFVAMPAPALLIQTLKAPGRETPSWQCQHLPYWFRHSKPLGMRRLRGNASTCPIDSDTQSPWAWDAFVAMPAPALLIETLKAPGHEMPSWQCQHLPYWLRHSKPLGMRPLRGNASTCPIDSDTQSPWAWDAFVAMPAPALLIETLKAPGHETPSWQCQHLPYWLRHSKPLGMRPLRGNACTCPIDWDTQSPWAWDPFVAMPAPALLIQTLKAPGRETPLWQCQHLPYWLRHSGWVIACLQGMLPVSSVITVYFLDWSTFLGGGSK